MTLCAAVRYFFSPIKPQRKSRIAHKQNNEPSNTTSLTPMPYRRALRVGDHVSTNAYHFDDKNITNNDERWYASPAPPREQTAQFQFLFQFSFSFISTSSCPAARSSAMPAPCQRHAMPALLLNRL